MSTPASIARHPVHPMLVTIPIGLWLFSLVADICRLAGARSPVWNELALYTLVGGIAGALLAAVPGFIDWLSLVSAPARRIGTLHMAINLGAVGLYVINAWIRLASSGPAGAVPVLLSVLGIALVGVSGWLGGEMVYAHRVGVAPAETAQTARRAA